MITIIAVFLCVWATALAILLAGKMQVSARIPVLATLLFGMACWLVMGKPGSGGAPVTPVENASYGQAIEDPRSGMSDRFGPAGRWLGLSDAMMRRGRTEQAAEVLAQGLSRYPQNVDLWVAYGNALVAHGGGIMTPAAAMAFDRAASIEPDHPAPAFFAGLALAQSGDTEGARSVWQDLLGRSPADAPFRSDLEARLARLPPTGASITGGP